MSYWRERARSLIAELVKDLPEDATLDARKMALKGKGWAAHQNTFWGRKMWGQEVRRHLEMHGAIRRVQTRTSFQRYSTITGKVETYQLPQTGDLFPEARS